MHREERKVNMNDRLVLSAGNVRQEGILRDGSYRVQVGRNGLEGAARYLDHHGSGEPRHIIALIHFHISAFVIFS